MLYPSIQLFTATFQALNYLYKCSHAGSIALTHIATVPHMKLMQLLERPDSDICVYSECTVLYCYIALCCV